MIFMSAIEPLRSSSAKKPQEDKYLKISQSLYGLTHPLAKNQKRNDYEFKNIQLFETWASASTFEIFFKLFKPCLKN